MRKSYKHTFPRSEEKWKLLYEEPFIALKCLQIDKIQVRSYHYEAVVSLFFSLCCLYKKSATAAPPKRTSPTLSPSFILRHQWLRESRKQLVHLFLVNVSEYIINCLVNAQIRRIQKVRKMALLHRFLRLNDQVNTVVLNEYMEKYSAVVSQADTGIFTFVVTRSVTRDLHRDVTSKEFT